MEKCPFGWKKKHITFCAMIITNEKERWKYIIFRASLLTPSYFHLHKLSCMGKETPWIFSVLLFQHPLPWTMFSSHFFFPIKVVYKSIFKKEKKIILKSRKISFPFSFLSPNHSHLVLASSLPNYKIQLIIFLLNLLRTSFFSIPLHFHFFHLTLYFTFIPFSLM